jgi:hypothetical protein
MQLTEIDENHSKASGFRNPINASNQVAFEGC